MKDCSKVFHTASLFAKGNKEIPLDPVIKGTKNVLQSAKESSTAKRVVLISSCYAIAADGNS